MSTWKSNKLGYYVLGNNEPRVIYQTLESAQTEANRLAKENPGMEFTILRAISSVVYCESPRGYTHFAIG